MKNKAPEKYAQAKTVPTPQVVSDKPSFPSLCMPPTPGRTKIKGTGAATKGLTFGKNG